MSKARAEARRAERTAPPPPKFTRRDDRPPRTPAEVPEHFTDTVAWVKGFKEMIAEKQIMNGDIPPLLSLWRDGREICRIFCNEVDRDEGLDCAAHSVPGFAADVMFMTVDAHGIDNRWWDEKGRNPDPHELQHLCDNEGACELGLTTDTLVIMRCTKEGARIENLHLPYHVNKRTNAVHWQPEIAYLDSARGRMEVSGYVPNALRQIMALQTSREHLYELVEAQGTTVREMIAAVDPTIADASEEELQFHEDMGTMSALATMGWGVAWSARSDEEREAVDRSMARHGLTVEGSQVKPDASAENKLMHLVGEAARLKMRKRHHEQHISEMYEAAKRRRERGE